MKKQNLEHHVSFGFSFDNASNDYKVVSILTDTSHFVSRVSVYSLHWNSWKTIEHGKLNVRVIQPRATIVKGLFYWLIEENSVPSHFGLVWFNVQSGILGTTSLPGSTICRNVFEFKESVAVSTECTYDQSISIWKQDDDCSWIKILTLSGIAGLDNFLDVYTRANLSDKLNMMNWVYTTLRT
ncbi:hypothetical protein POM88_006741 [Heracleum sosnowskyi]|uniref:F-box associated beta-propeller type 3 domain-containing protein n=1 Tax=Heracleum sosnowskyi TaxID=360622 RepID=A0AAD8J464_9APIA|nr:hypothetical protein POM88_006741 [Heracleum sosnowskyi]